MRFFTCIEYLLCLFCIAVHYTLSHCFVLKCIILYYPPHRHHCHQPCLWEEYLLFPRLCNPSLENLNTFIDTPTTVVFLAQQSLAHLQTMLSPKFVGWSSPINVKIHVEPMRGLSDPFGLFQLQGEPEISVLLPPIVPCEVTNHPECTYFHMYPRLGSSPRAFERGRP